MGRIFIIFLITLLTSVNALACNLAIDTYTSVQDGSWDVAATWGNNGNNTPGFNDHIVISSGDSVYHNGNEIIGRLRIQSFGTLQSNSTLRVAESYTNNGAHYGTGALRLVGNNDSIVGAGLLETTSMSRADGFRVIYPGSSITIRNTTFRLPNNDTLVNRGTLTMENSSFDGNGSGIIKNDNNAMLLSNSPDVINSGAGELEASAFGNTVNYNASSDQNIFIPISTYYNLTLEGGGTTKSLVARTKIDHDLKVDGPTLSLIDTFSITIGRDLDLVDGVLDAQNGLVEFDGISAQSIKGHVTFHDVRLNSSGGVAITQDSMRVMGSLWLDAGSFNTNDRLTILSNAGGDGSIGPITGGSISGDVTMQRYIGSDSTNWRFLGSPTTNAIISDWQDDFITAGYPGSHYPSFNFKSILGYDETVLGFSYSGAV